MKNIVMIFKILAFVLVAVCFTLAVSQSLSAGVPGDVNDDGKRGLEDVILILQEISNIRELIDEDNDGYVVPVDCNDTDPNINPGSSEICDGLDNDCDGQTDEELTAALCENQAGVCAGSEKYCAGTDGWQPCTSETYELHSTAYQESEITCDGLDNDCDGQTDEDLTAPLCEKQSGVCAGSKKHCDGPEGWQPCTSAVYEMYNSKYEESETDCDGIDNDCDGQTDEQCFP